MVKLTNTSLTDQVRLNRIASTASSAFLNIDTDPLNANAPLFLDPLASSGLLELFDVSIAPGQLGGATWAVSSPSKGDRTAARGPAFTDLVNVRFDFDVHSPISAVPEPRSFTLSAAGFSPVIALMTPRLANKRERTQP